MGLFSLTGEVGKKTAERGQTCAALVTDRKEKRPSISRARSPSSLKVKL